MIATINRYPINHENVTNMTCINTTNGNHHQSSVSVQPSTCMLTRDFDVEKFSHLQFWLFLTPHLCQYVESGNGTKPLLRFLILWWLNNSRCSLHTEKRSSSCHKLFNMNYEVGILGILEVGIELWLCDTLKIRFSHTL